MKVSVLGATGILGQNLIPLLLKEGHNISVLVRSLDKARAVLPAEVECIEFDLLKDGNEEVLTQALTGCDAAVHAVTAIPDDMNKPRAWDANTKIRTYGTRKFLDAVLKAGVKKYVQQSIVMAYPDKGNEWISEETPIDMSDKRDNVCRPVFEMEKMVKEISVQKLQWNILRGGIFVGRGTFQDKDIEALKSGTETIHGDGSNYVSFIHVKDMAAAIVKTLNSNLSGKILNIVDEPIRRKDYVERLCVVLGKGSYIIDTHQPNPPSHRCSNNLAKRLLDWVPAENIFSV